MCPTMTSTNINDRVRDSMANKRHDLPLYLPISTNGSGLFQTLLQTSEIVTIKKFNGKINISGL